MAKVLIFGRHGQVAHALREALPIAGHEVEALGRAQIDLGDTEAARRAVLTSKPDIVINAAAYTAVDKAEQDEPAARALNSDGPAAAAAAAAEVGALFVQFSTDYVFDGSQGRPYAEADATSPLGVYGRTKLDGETAIAAANPRHLILRTSWVCSAVGSNFLKTMLRLAGEREELGVVDDQRGTPTFAVDLADATVALLGELERPRTEHFGVFHCVGQGDTTWCGFAQAIMEESAALGGPSCRVRGIATSDYPTLARRPADSRLLSDRLKSVYNITLPEWRVSLRACLEDILIPPSQGTGQ
jgi:dTDP-4-dehydrorhamnose reductase